MGAKRRGEGAAEPGLRPSIRRWAPTAAAVAALTVLGACGGRVADPIALKSDLDSRLNCAHLGAEKAANLRRMEDLRDERVDNRIRSVARLPGAIIGNPLSAIALADPSVAIYEEIGALEKRNERIDELLTQKRCGEAPTDIDSAVAAPLDPIDVSLYEASYDVEEPAEEALAEPQPEVAPQVVYSEEAAVAVAPVVQALERDEAAAQRLAEEVEAPPQ